MKSLIWGTMMLTLILSSGCRSMGGKSASADRADDWKLSVQTYTFNRFTLFEAIDKAESLGLGYIEGYEWQRVSPERSDLKLMDASDEVLEEVRAKMASAGITMPSIYSSTIGASEEHTAGAFDLAEKLGTTIIVCEPAESALPRLDEIAQARGMSIAIHNHPLNPDKPGYVNWNPENVMRMIADRSRHVGTCADVGHWIRSGIDPVEGLKTYEGRLISVHLKDLNEQSRDAHDVVWGTGVGKFKDVLAELDRQKFKGVLAIEYEHNWENNVPEIADSIAYFKKVSRELGYR